MLKVELPGSVRQRAIALDQAEGGGKGQDNVAEDDIGARFAQPGLDEEGTQGVQRLRGWQSETLADFRCRALCRGSLPEAAQGVQARGIE